MYRLRGLRELAIKNLSVIFSDKDKAKAKLLYGDIHDRDCFDSNAYQEGARVRFMEDVDDNDMGGCTYTSTFKYKLPVLSYSDLYLRYKSNEVEFKPSNFIGLFEQTIICVEIIDYEVSLKEGYEKFEKDLDFLARDTMKNGKLVYKNGGLSIYMADYYLEEVIVLGVCENSIEFAFIIKCGKYGNSAYIYDMEVAIQDSNLILFKFKVSDDACVVVPMSRNRYKFEKSGYLERF